YSSIPVRDRLSVLETFEGHKRGNGRLQRRVASQEDAPARWKRWDKCYIDPKAQASGEPYDGRGLQLCGRAVSSLPRVRRIRERRSGAGVPAARFRPLPAGSGASEGRLPAGNAWVSCIRSGAAYPVTLR